MTSPSTITAAFEGKDYNRKEFQTLKLILRARRLYKQQQVRNSIELEGKINIAGLWRQLPTAVALLLSLLTET